MKRRYVLARGDAVLLQDWSWATLDWLQRRGYAAWVFRSRRSAERARRSYGRGQWRSMTIVQLT